MSTLTLTIGGTDVRFRSSTAQGAIDRFAAWMRTIRPECWQVATDVEADGAQIKLRYRQQAAVGGPATDAWVVTVWQAEGGMAHIPVHTDAEDALANFCRWLPRTGACWQDPIPAQTQVTIIFPDPERVPSEPGADDVTNGCRWLYALIKDRERLDRELRRSQMAHTTALYHLNRNELLDAREALAALDLHEGRFDYAVLPVAIRAALEAVSESVVRDSEGELREKVHDLADAVGLGWSEAALKDITPPTILGLPIV
ncbi:hypothetical protein EKD04_017345 [Chloroflexales bacterium ZM16-3]|nr:hypothetical protein [Chloroflexales bacterium ZM16-3]